MVPVDQNSIRLSIYMEFVCRKLGEHFKLPRYVELLVAMYQHCMWAIGNTKLLSPLSIQMWKTFDRIVRIRSRTLHPDGQNRMVSLLETGGNQRPNLRQNIV